MRKTLVAVFAAALTAPVVAASAGPADRFGAGSSRVTNPWFPLRPGTTYVYRGVKDGRAARDVVTVTHGRNGGRRPLRRRARPSVPRREARRADD